MLRIKNRRIYMYAIHYIIMYYYYYTGTWNKWKGFRHLNNSVSVPFLMFRIVIHPCVTAVTMATAEVTSRTSEKPWRRAIEEIVKRMTFPARHGSLYLIVCTNRMRWTNPYSSTPHCYWRQMHFPQKTDSE